MKKGFTLIELLAVIVILAIIAVIAVPIVIGIIDNAKTSANKRSIENYIHAVELSISQSILEGNTLSDGYHNIEMFDIKVSGETPGYGYIEIKDGKIIDYHLNIDNKSFSKEENETEETQIDPMKATAHLSIDYVNHDIIKGISFSYEDSLALNFYIDKEKINNKEVYLKGYHSTRYNPKSILESDVKTYKETNKYYIFKYNDFEFSEFTNDIKFEIIDIEGNVLDTINYDLSTYANNKIYKTENEFENKVLISLMNLGAATQISFKYKVDNLANKVLKAEDKNLDKLTEDGLKLYNRIMVVNIDLNNNDGQYFVDNGINISNSGISLSNIISSRIRIKKSSIFSDEEIEKYGFLVFDEKNYNHLKINGIEYFSIESNNMYDNINLKNVRTEITVTNNNTSSSLNFYYTIPMSALSNNFYIMPYYINSEGIYKYGKLIQYNVMLSAKKLLDSTQDNPATQNLCHMILNFCELVRID